MATNSKTPPVKLYPGAEPTGYAEVSCLTDEIFQSGICTGNDGKTLQFLNPRTRVSHPVYFQIPMQVYGRFSVEPKFYKFSTKGYVPLSDAKPSDLKDPKASWATSFTFNTIPGSFQNDNCKKFERMFMEYIHSRESKKDATLTFDALLQRTEGLIKMTTGNCEAIYIKLPTQSSEQGLAIMTPFMVENGKDEQKLITTKFHTIPAGTHGTMWCTLSYSSPPKDKIKGRLSYTAVMVEVPRDFTLPVSEFADDDFVSDNALLNEPISNMAEFSVFTAPPVASQTQQAAQPDNSTTPQIVSEKDLKRTRTSEVDEDDVAATATSPPPLKKVKRSSPVIATSDDDEDNGKDDEHDDDDADTPNHNILADNDAE